MATSFRDTSLLGKIRELPGRQLQIAALLIQLALAIWIPWRLAQIPALNFEIDSRLIVKSLPNTPGVERAPVVIPNVGDQVLAANGVAVATRPELLSALQSADGPEAELTIRRFNVALVKGLSPQSFEFGIPVGLQEGDLPVGLACQTDASYVEIRSVNLEALQELVRERSRDGSEVRVVFNRPQQDEVVRLPISKPPWRHDLMGVLLSGVLIQALLWWLSGRDQHPSNQSKTTQHANLLSALIPLATLACVAVTQRDGVAVDPLLFVAATTGLALFKPLNFDLHLRARSAWNASGLAVKLAIYTAPVIFLGQVLFFHLRRSGPSAVVAQARDAVEQQIDRFWWLLLGCSGLLIALDVLTLLVRYHVRGKDDASPSALASRIGLGFSLVGALAAVYLLVNGGAWNIAGYLIAGAFCAQLLGDIVGMIDLPRAHWHEGDAQQALSPNNLKQFLLHTADLFPPNRAGSERVWLVLRLVPLMGSGRDRTLRSQPRALHARLALTRDEEVGHLLIARSVPAEWIDLLDMLQVEGGIIPRASVPGREDPIDGTAHRLAISCVWPLDTRHSTALLSAHIVVAAEADALEHWQPLDPMLVPSDHLSALGDRFVDITPAAVYHAALGASPTPSSTPAPLAPTISVGSVAAVGASPLAATPPTQTEPAAASLGTISAKFSSRRLRAALRAMQAEVERLHPHEQIFARLGPIVEQDLAFFSRGYSYKAKNCAEDVNCYADLDRQLADHFEAEPISPLDFESAYAALYESTRFGCNLESDPLACFKKAFADLDAKIIAIFPNAPTDVYEEIKIPILEFANALTLSTETSCYKSENPPECHKAYILYDFEDNKENPEDPEFLRAIYQIGASKNPDYFPFIFDVYKRNLDNNAYLLTALYRLSSPEHLPLLDTFLAKPESAIKEKKYSLQHRNTMKREISALRLHLQTRTPPASPK